MAQFYAWLGARKSARIRLAVMDENGPKSPTRLHEEAKVADPHSRAKIARHVVASSGGRYDPTHPRERIRLLGRLEPVGIIDDILPPRDPNDGDDEDEDEDDGEHEEEEPAVIREPDEQAAAQSRRPVT
jgi:hypothetical protein